MHVRGRGGLSSWERVQSAPTSPQSWAKSGRLVGREPAASEGEEEVDQKYGWVQRDDGRTGNSEGRDVGAGWCVHAHTHTGAHVCMYMASPMALQACACM